MLGFSPDIICLQETKVEDDKFPVEEVRSMGYQHILFAGEKAYNGVAVLSKLPLEPMTAPEIFSKSRYLIAHVPDYNLIIHNVYVPAGGYEADPLTNPKFKEKLEFLSKLGDYYTELRNISKLIVLGDLNVAPFENDVWSHKQLLKVVSHTPAEVNLLNNAKSCAGLIDIAREFIPESEKLYSWWSYRNRDWKKSNRGRRLDHIWCSSYLLQLINNYVAIKEFREIGKPSDHIPVMININMEQMIKY